MNATTNKKTMTLPSLLAFERKLEVSDALMHSGTWNEIGLSDAWRMIPIIKRQNRSTQSAFGIDDAKKSEPNPVAADNDDANLPMDKDTLRVSFTLRIIGNLGKPFACNDQAFQKSITDLVAQFKGEAGAGLETLALRYAYNIANGRFLWRNRVCAEHIQVHVDLGKEAAPLVFDATQFDLNHFEKNIEHADLLKLRDAILQGLNGDESSFVFLKVQAYAKLGDGQHVFPSQEMNMGEKKKVLFQLNGCAAIHNVKIGNALRTIDNWYANAEFPIAAEPYGSVTQIGHAFRKTKKEGDLYSLLLDWLNGAEIADGNKNYVVANLVRGGLFQGEGKNKGKGKGDE
jgi:CRISPR-associated protein Csy3